MKKKDKKTSLISINIKRFRKEKTLSQDGLSKLAGISFNTLAKIENSHTPNPTIETLKAIATALSVTVDDLIKYKP